MTAMIGKLIQGTAPYLYDPWILTGSAYYGFVDTTL